MEVRRIDSARAQTEADAIVVGVFEDAPAGRRGGRSRHGAVGGALARLIERKEFTGQRYETGPAAGAAWAGEAGAGRRPGQAREASTPAPRFASSAAAARQLAGKPRERGRLLSRRGLARRVDRKRRRRRDRRLPGPGPVSGGKKSPPVRHARLVGRPASGDRQRADPRRERQSDPPAGQRAGRRDLSRDVRRAGRRSRQAKRPGDRNLGREATGSRALRLAAGRGQGLEPPGAAGHPALSRGGKPTAAAGDRRQGRDVRLGRAVAQAARRHADHEVRQGRRVDHGRRHAGDRPA